MTKNQLTHVYCMPGLAANPSIFEKIQLPENKYEIHWLDWLLPKPNEGLKEYSKRLCHKIKHEDSVLIGVSFGGVIVQEMAQLMAVKRVIIISSVKSEKELPRRMRFARCTKLFKILPTSLARHVDAFEKLAVGDFAKKRAKLYKKYLSITDVRYLDWAIEKMVCWEREVPYPGIVHIHGDKDEIFPYKYIDGCITVPEGTHIMIINRFRWFNEHLEEIIETGKLEEKTIENLINE
ncbi:alpha/beta fold hydrolase [Salinimicrobium oceani]|uniref:Alpha/beta hydrolase n=1 Tax=Salinimicrobium oceani TaxID=2722702 RepID=A0ABX1CWY4_9FLAO|nr:alpha/beta hydrolase [Salinimicrobium oceani]NJW52774.1 alpha/beta hydrolase [Salinimicrobium oceani]